MISRIRSGTNRLKPLSDICTSVSVAGWALFALVAIDYAGTMPSGSLSGESSVRRGGTSWWLLIAARAIIAVAWLLVLGGLVMLAVVQPPSPNQNLVTIPPIHAFPVRVFLMGLVMGLFFLLPPLSGLALFFDRKHVSSVSEWTPSIFYYLMALPGPILTDVIAMLYLYERHTHVGTP